MNAKLVVEGKEFDIEILDPKLQELLSHTKKTGYERVEYNEKYFSEGCGYLQSYADCEKVTDEALYKCGNYYSNKSIAENNIRADNLMRQLRRFKVENDEFNPWKSYMICYNHRTCRLGVVCANDTDEFYACQYFGSEESAQKAIEVFRDELIWYFTEYKNSL